MKSVEAIKEELLNKYGRDEFYREWMSRVPSLNFPSNWAVSIVPPFGGAVVRFRVNSTISVYLDVDNSLGVWGGPYWEVYPYNGDTIRFDMEDTESLLNAIQEVVDGEDIHEEE